MLPIPNVFSTLDCDKFNFASWKCASQEKNSWIRHWWNVINEASLPHTTHGGAEEKCGRSK